MSRLIIELPEGITQGEREDLADSIQDLCAEWSQNDRSVGINAMADNELKALTLFEEALRQEPYAAPSDGTAKKNSEELFNLMAEYPELPVVPMVDSEIVADGGYNRWMGSWGVSYVGEYLIGRERIYFRDDDDIEEAITGALGWDAYEAMNDEEAETAYRAMPWVKAIIFNIDLPD